MQETNLKDDVKDLAETYTHEIINDAKKADKHTKNIITITVLVILNLLLIVILFIFISGYKNVSNDASEIAGKVAGTLSGIIDSPEAYNNGKYEGLSAKDTEAEIANELSNIASLEVLKAGVTISNFNKYGEDKYASLTVGKGEAIFTVNLVNASVLNDNDKVIVIKLSEPAVELFIDEKETKKIAEWQKNSWTGKTTDGYIAYLNSWNESRSAIKESISNYDVLIKEAKSNAETEIENLLKGFTTKSLKFEWQENS